MNDEEWQVVIDNMLNEFAELERVDVYFDRRWDQTRESTRGECNYVRVEDLEELLIRYRSLDFVAQKSMEK